MLLEHTVSPQPDANARMAETLARMEAVWAEHDARMAALPQALDCPQHGKGLLKLDGKNTPLHASPVYTCAECEEAAKAEAKAKRRLAGLVSAGLPLDALHATLANFDINRPNVNPKHHSPAKFHAAALAFSERKARNLILCGAPGIGKGHLAAALAIAVYDAGKTVAWVECSKLFRAVHAAYSSDDTDPDDITGTLGRVGLFVLDELCLRDLPADGEEILFTILDQRHKAGLPTIMMGNKPAADVRSWLGSRISDRLRSGGVIFCYGEWESMRGGENDGSGWIDPDDLPQPSVLQKRKPMFRSSL